MARSRTMFQAADLLGVPHLSHYRHFHVRLHGRHDWSHDSVLVTGCLLDGWSLDAGVHNTGQQKVLVRLRPIVTGMQSLDTVLAFVSSTPPWLKIAASASLRPTVAHRLLLVRFTHRRMRRWLLLRSFRGHFRAGRRQLQFYIPWGCRCVSSGFFIRTLLVGSRHA